MGFFLSMADFESIGTADYVSNIVREDAIKMMRETADRLEGRQDIPATRGNA